MAERVTDLRDIRDRVIAELNGLPEPGVPLPDKPSILCAEDLAPADTAGLDPTLVVALATTLGGPTSHTAIIARQLGIPCVVAVTGLDDVPAGAMVLVDGARGTVTVDPGRGGGPRGRRRSSSRRRRKPRNGRAPGQPPTATPSPSLPTSRTAPPPAQRGRPPPTASGCSAPNCASSTPTPNRPSPSRPTSTPRSWKRSPAARSSSARSTPARTSRSSSPGIPMRPTPRWGSAASASRRTTRAC